MVDSIATFGEMQNLQLHSTTLRKSKNKLKMVNRTASMMSYLGKFLSIPKPLFGTLALGLEVDEAGAAAH